MALGKRSITETERRALLGRAKAKSLNAFRTAQQKAKPVNELVALGVASARNHLAYLMEVTKNGRLDSDAKVTQMTLALLLSDIHGYTQVTQLVEEIIEEEVASQTPPETGGA